MQCFASLLDVFTRSLHIVRNLAQQMYSPLLLNPYAKHYDLLVYSLSSICSFLQANTFQCVLATNGTHSFSVFLYADGLVQWTRYQEVADLQDQVTVEVGFNALSAYFSLPTSHTEYVLNITTASNARMPGEWVFRIDEPSGVTFPGTCTIGGLCCVRTSTMNQTCVSFCMLNVR